MVRRVVRGHDNKSKCKGEKCRAYSGTSTHAWQLIVWVTSMHIWQPVVWGTSTHAWQPIVWVTSTHTWQPIVWVTSTHTWQPIVWMIRKVQIVYTKYFSFRATVLLKIRIYFECLLRVVCVWYSPACVLQIWISIWRTGRDQSVCQTVVTWLDWVSKFANCKFSFR